MITTCLVKNLKTITLHNMVNIGEKQSYTVGWLWYICYWPEYHPFNYHNPQIKSKTPKLLYTLRSTTFYVKVQIRLNIPYVTVHASTLPSWITTHFFQVGFVLTSHRNYNDPLSVCAENILLKAVFMETYVRLFWLIVRPPCCVNRKVCYGSQSTHRDLCYLAFVILSSNHPGTAVGDARACRSKHWLTLCLF